MNKCSIIKEVSEVFILWIISKRDCSGYDIMKIARKGGIKKICASRLYPILNRLLSKGYIKIKSEHERNKKIYTITELGNNRLNEVKKKIRYGIKYLFLKDMIGC